jgi:hypothetical protein
VQERYKECPNPTCKAHLEHWEFFDNEEFCSVCGERLRTVGQPGPAPTNTMAAMAAADERPYIDSYMEVRNTNSIVPALLAGVAAVLILLLIGFLVFRNNGGNSNATTASNLGAVAATQTAAAAGTATAQSIVNNAVATNSTNSTDLPPAPETPAANQTPFPTATPVTVSDATPIPLAQGGTYLIHNIGMVASCTNSAAKPNYAPNESFYIMVQADFGHSGVYEIHPVWQAPPGYNTIFNAIGDAMSIGNTDPSRNLRDGGMYYVCFRAIPPAPQNAWPVGNYRVNIYINNSTLPVASRDFSVVSPLAFHLRAAQA